jgi:hypothetical protein
MTISQLKRSTDRRFDHLKRSTDLRFDRLGREMRQMRREIRQLSEDTRRHFDVVAESLRDDLRIFADAIGLHSERLDGHEIRLSKVERRF